jgi:transketolase
VVYVFTHDSIGLGEDGTTHQPIEQLAGLRAIPGLTVIRPADANATALAVEAALDASGPVVLSLSRQDLPVLDPATFHLAGSIVDEGEDATIVAAGSEVHVAREAGDLLAEDGISVRVVSLPSWEAGPCPPRRGASRAAPTAVADRRRGSRRDPGLVGVRRRHGRHRPVRGVAPAAQAYAHLGVTATVVADRLRALLDAPDGSTGRASRATR